MGKHKHSKDKVYKTVGELSSKHIANADLESSALHRRLKYYQCCLTFEDVKDGHLGLCDNDNYCYVFSTKNIVKFLEKHQIHPITGKKLSSGLIKLKFHTNEEGTYHCPILLKPFNQRSKIVAYKNSGNVLSYEAYHELNLKSKNYKDLITDEPISKSDIVIIQDPDLSPFKWDVNEFYYLKNNIRIFDDEDTGPKFEESGVLKSILEEYRSKADKTVDLFNKVVQPDQAKAATLLDKFNSANYSDGSLSRSVTSTVMPIRASNVAAELSEDQIIYPKVKKKGYVQLVTNYGPLNLELHCDKAPKTCHNFMLLASRGYYNGTTFHRMIKNFMIQGGDPTGTGRGGESAWGGTFKDEFHADLKHSDRGVLAMANSGPDTNKSQFYILLRGDWPHLDGCHTVFGRVVGGDETLKRIETVETDKKEKPQDKIEILKIVVYIDPFKEVQEEIRRERSKKSAEDAGVSDITSLPTKKLRTGIGTYIDSEKKMDKNSKSDDCETKRVDSKEEYDNKSEKNQKDIVSKSQVCRQMQEKLASLKPKNKQNKPFNNFSCW